MSDRVDDPTLELLRSLNARLTEAERLRHRVCHEGPNRPFWPDRRRVGRNLEPPSDDPGGDCSPE